MPPRINGRYEQSLGRYDENGNLFLTERVPLRYDPDLEDTRQHEVATGDTLPSIAFKHYISFLPLAEDRIDGWGPEHLWWVIAEFQPIPILDPTLSLVDGTVLEVPSPDFVRERVFGN